MAKSLLYALESLQLGSPASGDLADDWIDHVLEEQRPRKRVKQDEEQFKRHLEKNYLTPSSSFSPEWLNRLQQ
jgi:antiviral helicase SKI2